MACAGKRCLWGAVSRSFVIRVACSACLVGSGALAATPLCAQPLYAQALYAQSPADSAVSAAPPGDPAELPDAPQPVTALQPVRAQTTTPADGSQQPPPVHGSKLRPCPGKQPQDGKTVVTAPSPPVAPAAIASTASLPTGNCQEEDPIQPIVETATVRPLTSAQKGRLAFRDLVDPFNLITIGLSSSATIGFDAHTAYGPGLKGAGRLAGYSFTEAAFGEFFATYAISSLTHEDPRYHRMPGKPVGRRLLHAVLHTYVANHDDGSLMPNYGVLLTYPLAAETFNLYVPGTQTDLPSTGRRVAIGIATNPAGDIVAEFLPDFARRIHVRIVFIQQIMNQVALGAPSVQ